MRLNVLLESHTDYGDIVRIRIETTPAVGEKVFLHEEIPLAEFESHFDVVFDMAKAKIKEYLKKAKKE